MVEEISTKTQLQKTIKDAGGKPVVVDWFMNGCQPCRMIAPEVERLSKSYAGRVVFKKICMNRAQRAMLSEHKVRSFPTFSFFKNGKKVDQWSGASAPKLESTIQRLLGSGARANANNGDNEAFTPEQIQYFIDAGIVEEIWSDDEESLEPEGEILGATRYNCPICRKSEFSKKELVKHMAACELLFQRCSICHQMYEKKMEEEHIKEGHKLQECECGLRVMACKMDSHLKRCAAGGDCMYCGKPQRIRGMKIHAEKCGARIERCQECGVKDSVKNIVEKIHKCPPPCPWCKKRIEEKSMRHHKKNECTHRPTKCKFCTKEFMYYEIEYHIAECKEKKDEKKNGDSKDGHGPFAWMWGGSEPQPSPKPEPSAKSKGWNCPVCTFLNAVDAKTCKFCATAKPVGGDLGAKDPKVQQVIEMTSCTEAKARQLLRENNDNVQKAINNFFS